MPDQWDDMERRTDANQERAARASDVDHHWLHDQCEDTRTLLRSVRRQRETLTGAYGEIAERQAEVTRALASESRWRRAVHKAMEALSVGDPDSAAAILEAQIEH
jgi:hypothetical protein